jgi:hypothetical protein
MQSPSPVSPAVIAAGAEQLALSAEWPVRAVQLALSAEWPVRVAAGSALACAPAQRSRHRSPVVAEPQASIFVLHGCVPFEDVSMKAPQMKLFEPLHTTESHVSLAICEDLTIEKQVHWSSQRCPLDLQHTVGSRRRRSKVVYTCRRRGCELEFQRPTRWIVMA